MGGVAKHRRDPGGGVTVKRAFFLIPRVASVWRRLEERPPKVPASLNYPTTLKHFVDRAQCHLCWAQDWGCLWAGAARAAGEGKPTSTAHSTLLQTSSPTTQHLHCPSASGCKSCRQLRAPSQGLTPLPKTPQGYHSILPTGSRGGSSCRGAEKGAAG